MTLSLQSGWLKGELNPSNYKKPKHAVYKNASKITLSLAIIMCSVLAVGCTTMRALEPTAILISDIAKVL